jgi:predicted acyl esterase
MRGSHSSLLAGLLIILTGISGCITSDLGDQDGPGLPAGLTDVHARHLLPFNVTGDWSETLESGLYEMLPVESVFVDVDLPLEVGGAALTGDARVHMGIFRPDVPEGTKVPVIADIGPYYGTLDTPATEPANRLGRFLIENFVQHGYAVAQVSVFGSGLSNHCMDLMGHSEQLGVDAAVTYLGQADWSNGNVGLIGRSYDGSTPWQAATFGNPHLATIVPISGLIGMHELMWRNGSAETRAPIMHNVVYGTYGVNSDVEEGHVDEYDWQNLCRDYVLGPVQGGAGFVTGDHVVPEVNEYWEIRHFLPRVLENYQGSVYFIQGMQDWNVDPHMAFPTHHLLEEAGIEVKGLYGQWGHHYPDRAAEHESLPAGMGQEAFPQSVRYDWAQDLLEWFNYYLKEDGPKPPLHTEIQDHRGAWRIEETYPPRDLDWKVIQFAGQDRVSGDGVVSPAHGATVYEFGPFNEEVRLAGTPRLHLNVIPTGPGGQVFAYLHDKTDDLRLGHAIMDVRFHAGGTERQEVVPGQQVTMLMEFQAMDVVIPAGHVVELRLSQTGMGYLPSAVPAPVLLDAVGPGAVTGMNDLKLPVRHTTPEQFFTPPQ